MTDEIAPLAKSPIWVEIDFVANSPDPARVFRAATAMIEALTAIDAALVAGLGVEVKLEPILIDIEVGSLRAKLANEIKSIPDEILAKAEIRPILGHFLVRAKHAFLRHLERKERGDLAAELADARREVQIEAEKSGVARLGYTPPSEAVIADRIRDVIRANAMLGAGDRMRYVAADQTTVLDRDLVLEEAALQDALTHETVQSSPSRMILKVKRPDFLGRAQWEFRYGGQQLSAKIEDIEWLAAFQSHAITIGPGDSLDAMVTTLARYTARGELLQASHTIVQVLGIISEESTVRLIR